MEQKRTVAVRVSPQLHATLQLLAKLSGHTLAEEIMESLDEHIARKGSGTNLAEQAEKALAEIESESASRKQAIQSLLANQSGTAAKKGRKA